MKTIASRALSLGRRAKSISIESLSAAIRRARPDIFITPKIIGEFEAGRMEGRDGVMLELYRLGWKELQKGGARCSG